MTDRAGELPNSPLIYAIASVRFAAWPLLAKKIDEIHDELREIAPLIHRIQVEMSGPDMSSHETPSLSAWMIMSSDRSYGIQLAPGQVLFLSSKYRHYAHFEGIFDKVLSVLLKHMRFMDVASMGVRYVDRIVAKDGEKLQKYVAEALMPPNFPNLERVGGNVLGIYKSGEVELWVRSISQPQALSIPEDLFGILAMMHQSWRTLNFEHLKQTEMILDIDAIKNNTDPQRLEKQEILDQLRSLHEVANALFRHESVCTEHAFKVWKGEK